MSKRFDILIVVVIMALVCKTYAEKRKLPIEELRKLPLYKCMLNKPKDGGNNCVVDSVRYSRVRNTVNKLKLPPPTNGKMTFKAYYNVGYDTCDLYGKVTFAYTAMDVEGFEIELISTYFNAKYYNVALPKNYQQSIGGRFSIGLTFDIPTSLSYRITALPYSSTIRKRVFKSKKTSCVNPHDYQTMKCNESSYVISTCEPATNETSVDVRDTTLPPTTSSPTISSPTSERSGRSWWIVGLMIAFVIIICLIGAAVMRKKMNKKGNKKRAVILASSGDNTSKFTDLANLIASQLKLSNQFEEVFFTGWLQVNNLGSNLEQLLDALHRSTVVILFASPYGKTSYENFLQQGQLATWKDEFILGAHSLFRPSNHTTIQSRIKSKKCTVYVVYQSNDKLNKSDFLHEDFERHAYRCYDLSIPQDNTALYKKLLHRRKVQPLADDQEPGGDEEHVTTKFI